MARTLPIAFIKDGTHQAVALELLRRTPGGCTSNDVADSYGGLSENWSEVLRKLTQRGAACWVPDPKGKAAHRKRYFAAEFAENAAEFSRQRKAKVKPKKRAEFYGLRLDPAAPAQSPKGGPRVTVGPAFDPGARWRPAEGEMAPLFSCLAPGRYLDRDTWASRAYGRRG